MGEGVGDAFTVVCGSARARRGGCRGGGLIPSGGRPVRGERVERSRWSARFEQEGHVAPKPTGGDHTSQHIEAHADLILTTYEAQPHIFLHELRDALTEHGVQTSTSGLSRFFARHAITREKGRFTPPSRSGRT